MKDCTRYAPLVGAREGELDAAEAKALGAHLAGCAACRDLAAAVAATDGLVAESLLARAAARDFSPFVDQVMDRVYGPAAGRGVLGFLHAHWRAVAATLAPALAALALFMYVRSDSGHAEMASLEVNSMGGVSTVIQTQDGPVVLIDDDDGPDDAGI